ncbi:MAG TPA: hypothetical protein VHS29_03150, partial [Candidatus Acidoferrales bacterium]|nr:hypothetical protein [Candidatus Acidoferrales bacterium]
QNGSGGTGDTSNVVMLREPKPLVTQRFGVLRQGAGIAKCFFDGAALTHMGEIKYGERRVG